MSKVDYREILRLDSLHYSRKRISISIGSSHHTVKDVLDTATQKGITWPLDNDVTNAELEALLFPNKHKVESIYAEPDYAYIHRELAKTGVTLTLLWEEYCRTCHESGRTPYMSTQFGDKYRKWARITKATMRITHKPGDAMEVDWAGDTIPVFDPVTGEADGVYLFVAVLPCSCYVYAEACNNMASENWLLCHVHGAFFRDFCFDALGHCGRKGQNSLTLSRALLLFAVSFFQSSTAAFFDRSCSECFLRRVRDNEQKTHACVGFR